MINFHGDATNALSETVTIATQQRKILDKFKTEIEAMRAQKEELSEPNIPEIENISFHIIRRSRHELMSIQVTKTINLVELTSLQ
uniref:Uncharacterized protein n=1 Tax=Romanomermis culicivorax TaxID=13658 RepID=A0A915IY80_ROMCU